MSRTGPELPDLDTALRQALSGDPPRPVEQRLRASLRPAWRRAQEEPPSRLERPWRLLAAWSLPAPRAALATLAVSMVLGGAGWNLAHAPQAAASSLSTVMAARSVARAAATVSAMTCSIDLRGADGQTTTALVEWQVDAGTVIRIGDAPPVVVPPAGGDEPETVLARIGTKTPERLPAADLPVPTLRDYLSPGLVAAALDGAWAPVDSPAGASGWTYRVERSPGIPISVTLDPESGLPRLITTPDVVARCDWAQAPPRTVLVSQPGQSAPATMEDTRHDD